MYRFNKPTKLSALILTAMAMTACGGGNSGGGGGGTTGGGATDSRGVLFNLIAAKFDTFTGANKDQENQQMLAYLQTRKEFAATGISDLGGVWARFTDGNTLVIANNDVPMKVQSRAAHPKRASASRRSRGVGLPTSPNVIVGSAAGPFFDAVNVEATDLFQTGQPYSVETDASVDTLEAMKDIGFLYLTAHGCSCPIVDGGQPVYLVMTSTVRTPALDKKYAADRADGSLTYFSAHQFYADGDNLKYKTETHYAITPKFVTKYWTGKFNTNSLVYFNACSSASDAALAFEASCLHAGASYYLGWSNKVNLPDGSITGMYLIDRMLGANSFDDKETPPQKPFDLGSLLFEMSTRKRTYTDTMYDATLNPETGIVAKLQFLTLNDNFGQLAPTIDFMGVEEQKDELTLSGTFGDEVGTVSINDTAMPIVSWSATEITCKVPRTGNANSSGNVIVQSGKTAQHSNVIQLIEWKGTAKGTAYGNGTLKMVINIVLRFRTTVNSYRTLPHQDVPLPGGHDFRHSLASSGDYAFSGTYTTPDNSYTEQWSGTGTLPANVIPPPGTDPPPGSSLTYFGGFNDPPQLRLDVTALAYKGNHLRTIYRDTKGNVVSDSTVDTDGFWNTLGDLNGGMWTTPVLGLDYIVKAGSVSHSQPLSLIKLQTLEWSQLNPTPTPDPEVARAAHIHKLH